MSATPDSTLANPEQRIADLERQLAECRAERDANQAQREAMAEVLGVINSSRGDLSPVFDAMLEKATRLCDAAFGQRYTYDGEAFTPAAVHGEAHFAKWLRERGPWRPFPNGRGPMARIVRGEHTIHIADVFEDESYRARPEFQQQVGTVCNLASRLCAGAKDGQILVSSRIAEAVEAVFKLEDLGELELRGLRRPVAAFNVALSTSAPDARPNLTVVANEPGA